jgi:hypothetical protein
VRCTSTYREPLQTSYLPTKSVVERALELDPAVNFSILRLTGFKIGTEKLKDFGYRQWRFLEEFGVRSQPDLDFYKRALRNIKDSRQDPMLEVMKKIYTFMAELATARDSLDLRYVRMCPNLWNRAKRSRQQFSFLWIFNMGPRSQGLETSVQL